MAAITSLSVTLRGKVSSRVQSLTANGVAVTLAPDHTYAHTLSVPSTATTITLTTIDSSGLSETRGVLIKTLTIPAVAG